MLVRKPLNAVGLDIVRLSPAEPSEATRFLWLSSLSINTVLDVGAHIGEFATMIHRILPKAQIFSFEPLEDCFRQLQATMQSVSNFKAFRCALGDRDTKQDMYRNEFTPSSSLLQMNALHKEAFPYTMHETVETVEVRRLDNMVQNLQLEDNILVKIDVQGFEDRVIWGGESLIARAKLLIVETSFQPLYSGQALFDEIYSLVQQRGFKYMGNLDQLRNPVNGSVLQADAIFVKE